MLKILYVLNDTMRLGGTESVVLNYFYHINRETIHIDFMLHTTPDEADRNEICIKLRLNGANIYCVTPRHVSIIRNRLDIQNIFYNNHYDIIHSHADCVGAYILNIAKRAGIPIRIAHSHSSKIPIQIGNTKDFLHKCYLEFCRFNIRKVATNYMACSELSGKWMFGAKNLNNVYILKNAIDIPKFRYNEEKRVILRNKLNLNGKFVIGHVGRFTFEKNHDFIVDLFFKIYERNHDTRLLLVGTGILEEYIKEKVNDLGLTDAVIFYGSTSNVGELFQAFDVFVFPSIYEGLPVTLIEAQANGLPCYVSDCKYISRDACITNLVELLPLTNQNKWIEKILERPISRRQYIKELQISGYDIFIEAKKLELYYAKLGEKII